MNQWIIAPVVLPAMTGALLVLAVRYDIRAQRLVSLGATAFLAAIAAGLYWLARDGELRPYYLGHWPAPYGIVLMLDRLSATMLLITAAIASLVLFYAVQGWDRRGRHFHALFHFQLLGINGAFLTADIFNLFVFFEILLIASYGLMLHGGGAQRLKAGFQYVTINLIASTVFLFAVGLIYSVAGTLNMADLARKAPLLASGDRPLFVTGALLLLSVFAIKSALVPLHWWLPVTYSAASAPAAALFAVLTKVGAYSILRVYGTVFVTDPQVLQLAGHVVTAAALVTLAAGAIGMLASRTLLDLVCFSVVASMGTLLIPLGYLRGATIAPALYYLIHSTAISAALFLLVDLVAARRGPALDRLTPSPIAQQSLTAGLFFVAALGIVGMPPLSGFVGKLLILDATRDAAQMAAVWAVILGSSVVMLLSFARAGSTVFWKPAGNGDGQPPPKDAQRLTPMIPLAALIAAMILLTVFAGSVMSDLANTAQQLADPDLYIRAVLGSGPVKTGTP